MVKLWCIWWDHGEPTIKFNLLRKGNFLTRLGILLGHWRKFEIKLEIEARQWRLKGHK